MGCRSSKSSTIFLHRHHARAWPPARPPSARRRCPRPARCLSRSAFCAWMKVTSGRIAGTAASTSPVNGQVTDLMFGLTARQLGAAIAAEHGATAGRRRRPHRRWPLPAWLCSSISSGRGQPFSMASRNAVQRGRRRDCRPRRRPSSSPRPCRSSGRRSGRASCGSSDQIAKSLADCLVRRGRRDQMR